MRGVILHHPFQRRRVLRGAVLVLLRAAASSRDLCTTLVGVEAVEACLANGRLAALRLLAELAATAQGKKYLCQVAPPFKEGIELLLVMKLN